MLPKCLSRFIGCSGGCVSRVSLGPVRAWGHAPLHLSAMSLRIAFVTAMSL